MEARIGEAQQDNRSLSSRLQFLLLTCLGSVGIYFGYNIIGATSAALQAPPYNLDYESVGSLAAAYSFPNVIFPLFGGVLTDKIGVRLACVLFSGIVALGAFGFWLSLSIDANHRFLNTLLTGSMIVFGIGGESTNVAQKAMLATWFRDSQHFPRLAFATGLTLAFGYIGVIANRWTVPMLVVHGAPSAYLLSACVCLASFIALIGASWIHKCDEIAAVPAGEAVPFIAMDVYVKQESGATVAGAVSHKVSKFATALTELPRTFFILCAMLSITSPLFACFETFGPDVIVQVWRYDIAEANEITSLAQVSGLVFMPSIGIIYDKCDSTGRGRIYGASLGCLVFGCSWLLLANLSPSLAPSVTPYFGTIGIALGASMFFGGTWPCVPVLVDESNVGTAFGLVTAMQNTALSIILVCAGGLRDATGSYAAMGILLACQGATSALLGWLICCLLHRQVELSVHSS